MAQTTYRIRGIEPPGLRELPPDRRRAFWQVVVDVGLAVKDAELAAGLDRHGKALRPIAASTRRNRRSAMTPSGKGYPDAPPLMPAYELSRTRSLLAGRSTPDAAIFYWRFDPFTGESWGEILAYQAAAGRDVIGISPKGVARVRALSWERWDKTGHRVMAGATAAASPGVPQVGSYDFRHATFGIGASGPGNFDAGQATGGMAWPEWERYFRQANPGPVKIPGRPEGNYNRILAHVWGQGGPPAPPTRKPTAPPTASPTKPAPKPPPPESSTFEARLRAATAGLKAADAAAIHEAIRRTIEETAVAGPTGSFHGMSTPTEFRTIRFWGSDWHYTSDTRQALADTIYGLAARAIRGPSGVELEALGKKMPARLRESTRAVYFTDQSNAADDHWRRTYKDFHASAATAGDGAIVVYGRRPLSASTYMHEAGHNLAARLYGSTRPLGDYRKVVEAKTEPPVSEYAANSAAEDFAESVRYYIHDRARMKSDFPERYAIIHRIMTDRSYDG